MAAVKIVRQASLTHGQAEKRYSRKHTVSVGREGKQETDNEDRQEM
tara:strand:+ start:743 stop:880 length:138 start_codon:yes stop_codon:yes gene_type:complete